MQRVKNVTLRATGVDFTRSVSSRETFPWQLFAISKVDTSVSICAVAEELRAYVEQIIFFVLYFESFFFVSKIVKYL